MKKILSITTAIAASATALVAGPVGGYSTAPVNYSNAYTTGSQSYANQSYATSSYSGKGGQYYAGSNYAGAKGAPAPLTQAPALSAPISVCSCFEPGNASFSIYGASVHPDGHEDGLGGGLGVEYFFTRYLGLGADATWAATDSALHAFSASLIARLPFDSCFAPYIFGGGGVTANSATQGTTHIGAGVDWRFNSANCLGAFADGRQTWGSEYNFTLVRLGLKWNF